MRPRRCTIRAMRSIFGGRAAGLPSGGRLLIVFPIGRTITIQAYQNSPKSRLEISIHVSPSLGVLIVERMSALAGLAIVGVTESPEEQRSVIDAAKAGDL